MIIGLRIDADTYRGTRYGIPNLIRLLAKHQIRASVFFSVGPDNMGRHLFRLCRPGFLKKMLRSKAPNLYGWDILLRGTLKPGPVIGRRLGTIVKAAVEAGHEIGLHAWDHHAWQVNVARWNGTAIEESLGKGIQMLSDIIGKAPECSAAPGWRCHNAALVQKERFSFQYNSDCRGTSVFYPVVDGETLSQPQIPATLPTYDEVIGRNGISAKNYNDYLLSLVKPERLNVLTIHAEVEGMAFAPLFERFVISARSRKIKLAPLGVLLSHNQRFDRAGIAPGFVPGRNGWVACQRPHPSARADQRVAEKAYR